MPLLIHSSPQPREEDNIKHIVYVKMTRFRDVKKHIQALATSKYEQDFEPKSLWVQVSSSPIPRTVRNTDGPLLAWTRGERFLSARASKRARQQMAYALTLSSWPWRQADNGLMWDYKVAEHVGKNSSE